DGVQLLEAAGRCPSVSTRVLLSGDPSALALRSGPGSPADIALGKPAPLAVLRGLVESVLPARSRLRPVLGQLRSLPGTEQDSLFVKNAAGHYLFMNDAGAALLGRTAQDVV